MHAMILAAGRGERMGELTLDTPKPLLRVDGHYLIEFALDRLKRAGISDIVINVSYLGEKIKNILGNGSQYGLRIVYSTEVERLETGGGILQALPLLGVNPFVVMSSDIITDYPLPQLPQQLKGLGHLVMVNNPIYHSQGDFALRDQYLELDAKPSYTFANIAVLHPDLFAGCELQYFRLAQLLIPAIRERQMTGELYQGAWCNTGTPTDWEEAKHFVRENPGLRPFV